MAIIPNATTSTQQGGNTSASQVLGSAATTKNAEFMEIANRMNAENMAQQQAFNAQQAQLNREFQERMANTAYQRAVADMKAAHINPVLAYAQGGAATPQGSTATSSALQASMGSAVADQWSQASGYTSAQMVSDISGQFESLMYGAAAIIEALHDKNNDEQTAAGKVAGMVNNVVGQTSSAVETLYNNVMAHLGSQSSQQWMRTHVPGWTMYNGGPNPYKE